MGHWALGIGHWPLDLCYQAELGNEKTTNQETAVPIGVNLRLKALINIAFIRVQIPLNPP
jgi:hypothetical protein